MNERFSYEGSICIINRNFIYLELIFNTTNKYSFTTMAYQYIVNPGTNKKPRKKRCPFFFFVLTFYLESINSYLSFIIIYVVVDNIIIIVTIPLTTLSNTFIPRELHFISLMWVSLIVLTIVLRYS